MNLVFTICIDGAPQDDEYTDADQAMSLAIIVKQDDPDALVTVLITEGLPSLAERLRGIGATPRTAENIAAHFTTEHRVIHVGRSRGAVGGEWEVTEIIANSKVTYKQTSTFGARGAYLKHSTFAHVYHDVTAAR